MPQINTQVNKKCLICKKVFWIIRCRKNTAKYCSRNCSDKNPFFKSFGSRMNPIHRKIRGESLSKRGKRISLSAIHTWARRRIPKNRLCVDCKSVPPVDLANISQLYKKEISDWEWLCRKCHMTKDGRLLKFKKLHKNK